MFQLYRSIKNCIQNFHSRKQQALLERWFGNHYKSVFLSFFTALTMLASLYFFRFKIGKNKFSRHRQHKHANMKNGGQLLL